MSRWVGKESLEAFSKLTRSVSEGEGEPTPDFTTSSLTLRVTFRVLKPLLVIHDELVRVQQRPEDILQAEDRVALG